MGYVVYNTESTRLMRSNAWKTERAAKAALTRAVNAGDVVREEMSIASTADFYGGIEKQVEKTNLLSGEKYMESVNTPSYCSPSSEAYWSM